MLLIQWKGEAKALQPRHITLQGWNNQYLEQQAEKLENGTWHLLIPHGVGLDYGKISKLVWFQIAASPRKESTVKLKLVTQYNNNSRSIKQMETRAYFFLLDLYSIRFAN